MIDKLTDPKLQLVLGVIARLVPKDEYAKMAAALDQLVTLGKSLDARFRAIEQLCASNAQRLDMLESVVQSNVPGAVEAYSEQAQWLVPGRIAAALAPAKNGALNDDGNQGG